MPDVVQVIIVLAGCAAGIAGLRFPIEPYRGPLVVFGPSEKPKAGRIVAVTFLSLFGALGLYAMAQTYGWSQVLFLAPLFYFVLIFHVASNRFIQRFLVKPFLAYCFVLCVAGAYLVSVPYLWQALTTKTIPLVLSAGRGVLVSVDEDPFFFWSSVFACCLWVCFVLACSKMLWFRYRRGWPLSRYDPKQK